MPLDWGLQGKNALGGGCVVLKPSKEVSQSFHYGKNILKAKENQDWSLITNFDNDKIMGDLDKWVSVLCVDKYTSGVVVWKHKLSTWRQWVQTTLSVRPKDCCCYCWSCQERKTDNAVEKKNHGSNSFEKWDRYQDTNGETGLRSRNAHSSCKGEIDCMSTDTVQRDGGNGEK